MKLLDRISVRKKREKRNDTPAPGLLNLETAAKFREASNFAETRGETRPSYGEMVQEKCLKL